MRNAFQEDIPRESRSSAHDELSDSAGAIDSRECVAESLRN